MGTQKHPERSRPFGAIMKFRKKRCDFNRKDHVVMRTKDAMSERGTNIRTCGFNKSKVREN